MKEFFKVDVDGQATFEINGETVQNLDAISDGPNQFHILENGKSYHVTLVSFDEESKKIALKIHGHTYQIAISDAYDLLIEKMGLSKVITHKIDEIKAPMPGLVLDVLVKPGQAIEEGESLVILEAMKMENVIKSPGSGVVAELVAQKGQAVDKGAVLIRLD